MRWMLAALVLLLSAPAAAVVDVICPDGTRYIGTERPPCAVTCPDGGWVMPGEECRKPRLAGSNAPPTTKEGASAFDTPLAGTLAVVIIFMLYLLPAYIAFKRQHQNAAAILLTNLVLGWTGIGWIAALIWAATAVRREA